MAAVLQYINEIGEQKEQVWKENGESQFSALIKCYIQHYGEKKMQIIEKFSKRPASFEECCRFAQKLKAEYGDNLKQMIIWNLDMLKSQSDWL